MTDLDAWLYGTRVAVIRRTKAGRLSLQYTEDAHRRWGLGARMISVQLPLLTNSPPSVVIEAWLRGLLPEGRARARLAERACVDPNDVLGFLARYGRDTAGALVLVPEGDDPGQPDRPLHDLSEQEIADQLALADMNGAADQASSLAGLETKIVLTRTATGWSMPTPKAPSTHIVKLSRPEGSRTMDLIDTEAAALELACRAGISNVQAHLQTFAGKRAIVVTRYDRVADLETATVQRLHQEDAAQMLGLNTDDPLRKFQYGGALPSLAAIATKLSDIGVALDPLLALTTLNLAIGNVDAHAKNISVLHGPEGRHQLAPAYDIAMHLHQNTGEHRFAMDVAGERDMNILGAAHLIEEALSWRISRRRAVSIVRDTLERLEAASSAIDRDRHPGVGEAAWAIVDSKIARLNDELHKSFAPPVAKSRAKARAPQARMPKGHPSGGRFSGEL
ncbi:HipA domain-containing protein [Kineosporia babensis]|uniref:HipA domain-containing protein n=1 Tax=Kineosporia babensis TaxID=499548 RepID=A0A9X1SV39_9ACTN|nr:HipA domain-containing protein [Kineosporia babensis]MCD5312400.1 HipA domain-containing protein [Kineosporia babensis]